jgi:amicoumacin kinase
MPMNTAIKALLNEERLAELLGRFKLERDAKLLTAWHAFTYEVRREGAPCILRVTADCHRTPEEIDGELEWMEFVRRNGLRIPGLIPAAISRRFEVLNADDTRFTAVLFEKLPGHPVAASDWTPRLFECWGALVGRLHYLVATFEPNMFRPLWTQSDFLAIDRYIPADLSAIKRAAQNVIAAIAAFPREPGNFGLMHADVYQDNFMVGADGIELFDFDNSEYGFLVNDIAVALYGALFRISPHERQTFAELFLRSFRTGYEQEYALPDSELNKIPLFLRLRDVLIYTNTRRMLDLTRLTPIQDRLFAERAARIVAGIPIVDVSWRMA